MRASHFIFNLISQLSTERENEATAARENQSASVQSAATSQSEHANVLQSELLLNVHHETCFTHPLELMGSFIYFWW